VFFNYNLLLKHEYIVISVAKMSKDTQ